MADDQRRVQVLGVCVYALGTAHVRSGQREGVLELLLELPEDAQEVIAGVQVVDREVEEALDLVGVQVAGHEGVRAGHLEHVGHQFGANRHARLVFSVLTGPAVIRDNGDDFIGRCPLGGVDGEQQFHQVVRGRERGLDDETGSAADTFLVRRLELTVAEVRDFQRSQDHFRVFRAFHAVHCFNYLLRKIAGGITSKQRHPVLMDIVDHSVCNMDPI